MSKTLWRKQIINGVQCLVPDCKDADEWMSKTKLNQGVMIEPRRPRNIKHHKKLFALLHLAIDNWPLEVTPTVNGLLGVIKNSYGYYDLVETRRGTEKIPNSIAFESMDQTEFEPFYDHAVLVISRVLGIDPETLQNEAA